jgi:L-ascorbate oxidase
LQNINIGQRYVVTVEANQPTSNYWMRSIAQVACSKNQNSGLSNADAIVQYTGASSLLPTSTYANYTDSCEDEPQTSLVPIVVKSVDSTSFAAQASTISLNIARVALSTNDTVFRWTLSGISQDIDLANPTVAQVVAGNDTFPVVKDVITLTQPNTWFFWIVQNQFFVPHPLHLHGHDFSLLGQGSGTFDVTTNLHDLNFVNPPRRDVAILLASGWTVLPFQTDNPGV